jgi:hypothetical protein
MNTNHSPKDPSIPLEGSTPVRHALVLNQITTTIENSNLEDKPEKIIELFTYIQKNMEASPNGI